MSLSLENRIIFCTSSSAVPRNVSQELQPSKMVFRGRPHKSVLYVYQRLFPTVSDILFSENMAMMILHEAKKPDDIGRLKSVQNVFDNVVKVQYDTMQESLVNPSSVTLRHHLHCNYYQPAWDNVRQTYFVLRATSDSDINIDREFCATRNASDQDSMLEYMVSEMNIPPAILSADSLGSLCCRILSSLCLKRQIFREYL